MATKKYILLVSDKAKEDIAQAKEYYRFRTFA